jgi:hypothetical protein
VLDEEEGSDNAEHAQHARAPVGKAIHKKLNSSKSVRRICASRRHCGSRARVNGAFRGRSRSDADYARVRKRRLTQPKIVPVIRA